MNLIWTTPALDSLDQIQDYIAEDSPLAAFKLTGQILDLANRLLPLNPLIGRTRCVAGTRELIVPNQPYILVYRVTDQIEILDVFHAARNWPETF